MLWHAENTYLSPGATGIQQNCREQALLIKIVNQLLMI